MAALGRAPPRGRAGIWTARPGAGGGAVGRPGKAAPMALAELYTQVSGALRGGRPEGGGRPARKQLPGAARAAMSGSDKVGRSGGGAASGPRAVPGDAASPSRCFSMCFLSVAVRVWGLI